MLIFLGDFDKFFLMYVEDVFFIFGWGIVVIGKVECGIIIKGFEVEIVGFGVFVKIIFIGIGEFLFVWSELIL